MSHPQDIEQRLTDLEVKASFTEDLVDHLNQTIVRQQAQIDRLTRELVMLSDRLASAEQSIGPEPGDEAPPPHW